MSMNRSMKILTGRAHPSLAQEICDYLKVPLADANVTSFPDGESYVRIKENIRGRDIFLVQPTGPPTNQNLMELLIMVDAARRASADRITVVTPFFGYARQDRKDKPRVPITAKLVANLITAAGANRIVTVDLHASQIQGFFDIPVDHLFALPVMIEHIREMGFSGSNAVVVSPDIGGVKMASAYADALGCRVAIVNKQRHSATDVEAMHMIGEVEGLNALIVDDITETAGTLCAAARILKDNGAGKIYAGVSHAVLGETGLNRLADSPIESLITTNSTPVATNPSVTCLSLAPILGEAIRRIHENQSVTSLFRVEKSED